MNRDDMLKSRKMKSFVFYIHEANEDMPEEASEEMIDETINTWLEKHPFPISDIKQSSTQDTMKQL